MTTIKIPDTGFNSLQIGVAVNGNEQPGADSCFIDAIVLVQTGNVTAGVAHAIGTQQPALMNYPNPFYHASGTRVQVHAPVAGIGILSVSDVLGREVINIPLGAISAGDENVSIALETRRVFISFGFDLSMAYQQGRRSRSLANNSISRRDFAMKMF